MLVDEVTIKINAGKGGDGAVSFNKVKMNLGPVGASGGNGGNVVFEGVIDLSALDKFKSVKDFSAENGHKGKTQFRDGRCGEDLILKVPVGTIIKYEDSSTKEITKVDEQIIAAKGGKGGRGNFHFRSSTNTSPKQFEYGTEGESFTVQLELKLIADVGLIGLPSAGKSSLLNELTAATAKVGNYPFTTLEPNLGSYFGLIIADIPGLIEGASAGKGLGTKFLRHIERTKILFHLVPADSEDIVSDYKTIKSELEKHNPELLDKQEFVFISKSDTVSEEELKKQVKLLKSIKLSPIAISIHDMDSLKEIQKILNKIKDSK